MRIRKANPPIVAKAGTLSVKGAKIQTDPLSNFELSVAFM